MYRGVLVGVAMCVDKRERGDCGISAIRVRLQALDERRMSRADSRYLLDAFCVVVALTTQDGKAVTVESGSDCSLERASTSCCLAPSASCRTRRRGSRQGGEAATPE